MWFGKERDGWGGQPHSNSDLGMYVVAGLLGVLAVLTGGGMLANRLACEAWARPRHLFEPLGFFKTGDAAAFGETASGCSAGTWLVVTVWVIVAIGLTVVVVLGVQKWLEYRESDKRLIKMLRRRRGFAKGPEIKASIGRKAAIAMTGKVRPTLPEKERTPEKGNLRIGVSEGQVCWIGLEESVLLQGPPRSGKGVNYLVGAIIDAPGPVVTTSTRADNYALTAPLRAKIGPVTLFDPQGLTGKATTLKWSPITGCDRPQTANQRATSLIGAAGLSADGNNSEWRAPAIMIMQCLLHAAALERVGVDVLMRWGNAPAEAKAAVAILHSHESAGRAAPGWAAALEAEIDSDPKMRANKWFGVSNAVQGLSVDSVRDALNPRNRGETFDIDEFIRQSGTLYIIGTKSGGSSAGPFLIAMIDAITERGRELAARSPGNRLDPPMAIIGDEIANLCRGWDNLPALMSDGGGVGISVTGVLQSLAQARAEWGEQAAGTIFEAATTKLLLGGAANASDLEVYVKLAGDRPVWRSSTSRQKDGASVSEQVHDRNVVEMSELRRLPFSWAFVLWRKQRPILMHLRPYWERDDGKEIRAGKKLFDESLVDPSKEAAWNDAVAQKIDHVVVPPSPGQRGAGSERSSSRAGDDSDVTIF